MTTKSAPAYRIKFTADGDAGEISGLGSIFGNVDSYGEIVAPGAYRKSLAAHRKAGTAPLMLWQHDTWSPIGKWTEVTETSEGLFVRGKFNLETSWGRDAWAAVQGGDVDGLSVGYREVKASEVGQYRRLDELDLLEISVVSFPANRSARIQRVGSKRELEDLLIKSGLPREAAKIVARGGYPALAGGHHEAHTNNVKQAADRIARLAEAMRTSK
jgi:uncharacterized protein